MDINVKVRLESPELMAAMLALAEALPQIKLGSTIQIKEGQAFSSSNLVYSAENKNEEVAKGEVRREEVKAIALEDLRKKLACISEAGKQKEVKELIKKFGADKLTEILPKNYEALLKEAKGL